MRVTFDRMRTRTRTVLPLKWWASMLAGWISRCASMWWSPWSRYSPTSDGAIGEAPATADSRAGPSIDVLSSCHDASALAVIPNMHARSMQITGPTASVAFSRAGSNPSDCSRYTMTGKSSDTHIPQKASPVIHPASLRGPPVTQLCAARKGSSGTFSMPNT